MAIKKSQLYSSLWKSCDELRGGMDASQYKDYVLVLLFVKYVTDKYAGQPYPLIEVPPGGSFADMVLLKGDKEIGDKMNKIIARLAEANELKGVIDVADFNDPDKLGRGKDMVDRLSNLVAIFEDPGLDFSRNRAEGDDILGDAYEYLMRHFATQSGKSKGQFYTPAEVSRVMAQVIGIDRAARQDQTIYDPTCGSGSLLLKAADQAPRGVTIYGQEMDNATTALARMNMILHNNPTAVVWQDNTLSNPHFKEPDGSLKTFDYVVANPPFSNKAWSTGLDPAHDLYNRFADGIPPKKNGDYAFLLHILASLKSSGSGAVILPHGVLFRGNVEADIRRRLVQRGYIKGIIGLPPNLFYGTGIPACIIVLDKRGAAARTGIFLIDASRGFVKDGNKNRLRERDIHQIVATFNARREIPRYSRLVPFEEIQANDYNLNIPRYIDSSEPEDRHDIDAHLRGGIPERDVAGLARYWAEFPGLREELFGPGDRPGYCRLLVPTERVRPAILAHPEFVAFRRAADERLQEWAAEQRPALLALNGDVHPRQLIESLSESLLERFTGLPLLDPYDVYQHLLSYWSEVMQDDLYLIVAEGWSAAGRLRPLPAGSNGAKESPDLTIGKAKYKADLLPPDLLIERYFAGQRDAIAGLEAEKETLEGRLAELADEHGGEEGLLEEVRNEKGAITKAAVVARRREIWHDAEFADELEVLEAYLRLLDEQTALNGEIRAAQGRLQQALHARYAALAAVEISALVVDEKWLEALTAGLHAELDRLSQALAGRVRELAERYADPLPQLVAEVEALTERVDGHLLRMGFAWK